MVSSNVVTQTPLVQGEANQLSFRQGAADGENDVTNGDQSQIMFDYSANAKMGNTNDAKNILNQMTLSPARTDKNCVNQSPAPSGNRQSMYGTMTPDRDGMISPDKSTSRIMLQAYPTSVEKDNEMMDNVADFENARDRFRNKLRG